MRVSSSNSRSALTASGGVVSSTTVSTSAVARWAWLNRAQTAKPPTTAWRPSPAVSMAATARTRPTMAAPGNTTTGSSPDGTVELPLFEDLATPCPVLRQIESDHEGWGSRPTAGHWHLGAVIGCGRDRSYRRNSHRGSAGAGRGGVEAAPSDVQLDRSGYVQLDRTVTGAHHRRAVSGGSGGAGSTGPMRSWIDRWRRRRRFLRQPHPVRLPNPCELPEQFREQARPVVTDQAGIGQPSTRNRDRRWRKTEDRRKPGRRCPVTGMVTEPVGDGQPTRAGDWIVDRRR